MLRFLLAAAFAVLTASVTHAATPNIVIIFVDDMGYGDLGCYGAKGWKTPNLDRIAAEGVRFTDFHSSQPVCSASRAALLTGCYSNRIGIHGALGPRATHGIADSEMTLAEVVKQKGYATGMAGKWHLGQHPQFLPTRHGFDEYLGLPYSNDMWPEHPRGRPAGYPPLPLIEGEKAINPHVTHADQEKLTAQYTERAVKFIEKNKDRPFFFYLAHNFPHVPLHVGAKFKGSSQQGLYGDVIQELDWSVGEVLAAIKRSGIDERTLVMFTSDNGPWLVYGNHGGSAGPLREGKGTNFEGGHRVPFIARWPGAIPAGSVQTQPAMTIDIVPTVAKLIGAELPKHTIDGLDILPLLKVEPGASCPHDAYYCYYRTNELHAIRSGKWKLTLPHKSQTMKDQPPGKDGTPGKYAPEDVKLALYDLDADVGETNDVSSHHPEVVARLQSYAERARADLGDSLTNRAGSGRREPGRVP